MRAALTKQVGGAQTNKHFWPTGGAPALMGASSRPRGRTAYGGAERWLRTPSGSLRGRIASACLLCGCSRLLLAQREAHHVG